MTDESKTVDDMRRGSLRKELYVITSIPAALCEQLDRTRPRHLEYQTKLEKDGILFAAGPLFEQDGSRAGGLIILRVDSFAAAKAIADADPYHAAGRRTCTMQRWTVSEGSYMTYSDQKVDVV
jgi:hypothetical protein